MPTDPNPARGLFHAVVQLDPTDRLRYLDDASDDQDVKRRVLALLDAHDRAGDFLGQPVVSLPAATHPGMRCGPYTLLRVLGEGGMGVVWVAEQSDPIRREVAVKVVRPGLGSPAAVARFDAERRALARMSHPNVARVLDAGTTDTGQPYFAMELVEGVPVTAFCAERDLGLRQKLGVFLDVCRGVQHAHQKGVIHRDIKPSNVLVTVCDGRPVPKVIDFGVAKALHDPPSGEWPLTGYGMVLGTPEYMSPEQARPGESAADTRTDVYSLGVVLYELLTGTPPHGRGDGDVIESLRRVREDDPPRPTERVPGLPADLDWVAMKALEKDLDRRYESVAALAADVEHFLADEPVAARPPSRGYRARKFVRKHRGPVAAAAAVLVALVGGVVGTSVGLVKARAAERVAVAARDAEAEQLRQTITQRDLAAANAAAARAAERAAAQSEANARAVLQFVLDHVFAAGRPVGVEGGLGHDVPLRKAIDAAEPWVAASFPDAPLVAARVREVLGSTHQFLGDAARAKELHAAVLRVRRDALGPDHPDTITALNNLGEAHRAAGEADEAVRLFEQALALARPGTDTLPVRNNLGHVLVLKRRHADAIRIFGPALAEARAAYGENHLRTLTTQNNLAEAHRAAGQFDEAERLLLDALRRCRAALMPDHLLALAVENNLADVHLKTGRLAEAEGGFRAVVPRATNRMGGTHPHVLATLYNLGEALRGQGRADEAVEWHEKALAGRRKELGEFHHDLYRSMNSLTEAYLDAGRDREAATLARERLRKLRRVPEARRDWPSLLTGGGEQLVRAGDPAAAEPLLREALALRGAADPDGILTHNTRSVLGGALLGQGRLAEAEPLVLAGYAALKKEEEWITPAARPWLHAAGRRAVELYERTGRPADAARVRATLPPPRPAVAPPPRAR